MAESGRTTLDLQKNTNIEAEVASALALIEELSVKSSDSGLSEDTCWELFGGPCPEALRKRIKSLEKNDENEDSEEEVGDLFLKSKIPFIESKENLQEGQEYKEDKAEKAQEVKDESFEKEIGVINHKEGTLKEDNVKEDISLKSKTSEEVHVSGEIKSSKKDSLSNSQEKRLSNGGSSEQDRRKGKGSNDNGKSIKDNDNKEDISPHGTKTSKEGQLSGEISPHQKYSLSNGQGKGLSNGVSSEQDRRKGRKSNDNGKTIKDDDNKEVISPHGTKTSKEGQLSGEISPHQKYSLSNGQGKRLSNGGSSEQDRRKGRESNDNGKTIKDDDNKEVISPHGTKTSKEGQLSGEISPHQKYSLSNGQGKRLSNGGSTEQDRRKGRESNDNGKTIKDDDNKEVISPHGTKTSKEGQLSGEISPHQKYSLSNGQGKRLSKGGSLEEDPLKSRESKDNEKSTEGKADEKGRQKENNGNKKKQHNDIKKNSQESQKSNKDVTARSTGLLKDEKLINIEDLSGSIEKNDSKSKDTQESRTTNSIKSGGDAVTSRTTNLSTGVSSIDVNKKATDTLSSSDPSSSSDGPRGRFDSSESSDLQACNCVCCIERQIRKSHKKELNCRCVKREPLYCPCCNQHLSSSNNKFDLRIYNQEELPLSGNSDSCQKKVKLSIFDDNNPKSRSKKMQTSTVNMFNKNTMMCRCLPYDTDPPFSNPGYGFQRPPAYANKPRNPLPTKQYKTFKKDCKCSGGDFKQQITKCLASSETNNYDEDSESSSNSDQQHSNLSDSLKDTLLKRSVRETVKKIENDYSLQEYTESSDKDFHQPNKQRNKYKETSCRPISKNRRCCCGEPKSILKRRPNVPVPAPNACICCNHRNHQ